MINNDLINQLKTHSPNASVEIFGVGEVTKVEIEGEKIKIIAHSKAMGMMEAVEKLKSTTCRCGEEKRSGNSFCGNCYRRLPHAIQHALYGRVGNGYEQAYDLACRTLDEGKR